MPTVERTELLHIGTFQRAFHPSSSSHAHVLSDPGFLPPAAPILDIFDAPVRLGECRLSNHHDPHFKSPNPHHSHLNPVLRPIPTSLPSPLVLDGPACPGNPSFTRHRSAAPSRLHHGPSTAPRALNLSQPPVEVLDGPARITRCAARPRPIKQAQSRHLLLLGIVGAACGAIKMSNASGT
ncbi:hypothetical protein FPV67DRAFT_167356 [Lyophyllum atratum]|nr:hypothetical protein FPV67DRAFT_167356 [Lyophyllum atratum]